LVEFLRAANPRVFQGVVYQNLEDDTSPK